jgi:hypothetical protein
MFRIGSTVRKVTDWPPLLMTASGGPLKRPVVVKPTEVLLSGSLSVTR